MIDHLYYFAKSHIPSRHANSIQVVNMVCALSELVPRITLTIPYHYKRLLLYRAGLLFGRYGKKIPPNLSVSFVRRRIKTDWGFEEAVEQRTYPEEGCLFYSRSIRLASHFCRQNKNVLFESHDFGKDRSFSGFTDFLHGLGQNKRARIVAISTAIAEQYLQAGVRASQVEVFPDGVDITPFGQPRENFLGKLFGPRIHSRPVILYTGSLQAEKGAEFTAKAAGKIPDYNFLILGGNKDQSRNLAKQFSGLKNLFFHPAVSYKHIPSALHGADLLIMPYMKSGKFISYMSPLKMFEYLAAGKIILASRLPVLTEVLRDKENAFLFEPESISSLQNTLKSIENLTCDQRNDIYTQCLSEVLNYTWQARASSILNWYMRGTANNPVPDSDTT